MEPTPSPTPAEMPVSLAERCIAVAIQVMKPSDGAGLDSAIDYGRKLHTAVVEMERAERGRIRNLAPSAKRPGRRLLDSEKDVIARMAKAGDSTPAIMRETGLPESTIRGHIKRHGLRDDLIPAGKESEAAPAATTGSPSGDRSEDVVQGTVDLPPPPPVPPAVEPAGAASGTEIRLEEPRAAILAEPVDSNQVHSLTDEERDRAKILYEEGEAVDAIASIFEITPAEITALAQTQHWKQPIVAAKKGMSGVPATELDATKRRYEAGDKVKDIADDLNVSMQTIYNLASRHGWERPAVPGRLPSGRPKAADSGAVSAPAVDHHRAWSSLKVEQFTAAWVRGDDAEVIGTTFRMQPGTVAAAAAGLGIADDPRRKAARSKPAPAQIPVKPATPARRQAIEGLGDFLARKKTATVTAPVDDGLPSAEPPREVMLMDGPELASAVRKAGFVVSMIAGQLVPQWRIGNGNTVLGLNEMRRLVAGLNKQRVQAAE